MSLTKKLLIAFGAMLGVALLLGVAAVLVTQDLSGDLEKTISVSARKQYLAGSIAADAFAMADLERSSVMASVLGDKAKMDESSSAFSTPLERSRKSLKELAGLAADSELASLVKTLEAQTQSVAEAHEEVRQAMGRQQLDVALSTFQQKAAPRLEEIGRQVSQLSEQQNRDLAAVHDAAISKQSRTRWTISLLVLLALVVGGLVIWTVNRSALELKTMAGELAESAEQVTNAASQVSEASQSLAQGASQQAASLEETSASTEEISSITRKNADNARAVASQMLEADRRTSEVNATLDEMVASMNEIAGSSSKISRIIKVIDEIAFQTNILALNAAVEAARAGDAGLGFAVVADEVRSLAQRSAQAAKDTAALIEESIANSSGGNARLGNMAESVRALIENARQAKVLADEVNQGSQEQAHGMEQIARAVVQMEQVTQKTAASAEESAGAGTELSTHAATLRRLVGEMRTLVGSV